MTRFYAISRSPNFATAPLTLTPALALPPAEDKPATLDEVLDLLTKTQLRLYEKLSRWIQSKIRRGQEAYVCPSRAWLACDLGHCTPRTVTTAFACFKELGLLEIQERYRGRRHGLRRQLTNMIALPLRRPRRPQRRLEPLRYEVEKIFHQTQKQKTGIKKKVEPIKKSGRSEVLLKPPPPIKRQKVGKTQETAAEFNARLDAFAQGKTLSQVRAGI